MAFPGQARVDGHGLSPHQRAAAETIREQWEQQSRMPTLRELRDAFQLRRGFRGRRAPSGRECELIAHALSLAGLRSRRPLSTLALEAPVELERIDPPHEARDLQIRLFGWSQRPLTNALMVVFTVVPVVLAFGAVVLHDTRPQAPAPISGDVRFAIAAFTGADADADAAAGRTVARVVTKRLRARLRSAAAEIDTGVALAAAPAPTPPWNVSLPTLAAGLGADLLLGGMITESAVSVAVAPTLYLAPRLLPGAEELSGTFAYGPPLVVRGTLDNPLTLAQLEDRLAARLARSTDLVLGLARFQRHQFAAAYRSFERVERARVWDARGPALIQLLLGNAAIKQRQLGVAASHYAAALQREPGLLRARFASAEVDFLRRHGRCEQAEIDAHAVERALANYRTVAAAAAAEPGAGAQLLAAKSSYGAAQALFCLSRARVTDGWVEAASRLDAIIAHRGSPRDEAAVTRARAYALRAAITLGRRTPPRDAQLVTARDDYRRAIAATGGDSGGPEHDSLQAIFRGQLADVLLQLGDQRAALEQLRQAVALELDPRTRAAYQALARRLDP